MKSMVGVGHMTIFNQQHFSNKDDYRIGSDQDVKTLKNTFSEYGIDPIEIPNLTLKDIAKEVDECKN